MPRLKSGLAVIGAVTILVLAANTVALATTGQAFLLGKANTANTATSLTRTTNGAALYLHTKSSSDAPLSVSGKGKVANLNADKLDSKDSTAFAPVASAPIAYGFIETGDGTTPTLIAGDKGLSAVSWDAGNNQYDLTVTGQFYYFESYVAVITPTCGNVATSTNSAIGLLVVKFGSGTCNPGFGYVIYKLG